VNKSVRLALMSAVSIFLTFPQVSRSDSGPSSGLSATGDGAAGSTARPEVTASLMHRWIETKLPPFLQSRRAFESRRTAVGDAMDDINRTDLSMLQSILRADEAHNVRPNSELVDSRYYSSLQHQTVTQNLVGILRNGELTPRAGKTNDSHFGVYLELHLLAEPHPFFYDGVELHFDYSLLDRDDYHVTKEWRYGKYGPLSASPAANMGRTNFFISEYLHEPGSSNEIVFQKPVPLSALKKIVVVKGFRAQLLAEIDAAGIVCPVGAGWDALIEERARPRTSAAP
jgi:hypothetical protein